MASNNLLVHLMILTFCRGLATGVVLCAAGVGTFLVAPLAQLMLDSWGWRGAMQGLALLAGVSIKKMTSWLLLYIMLCCVPGSLHTVWLLHGPAPKF